MPTETHHPPRTIPGGRRAGDTDRIRKFNGKMGTATSLIRMWQPWLVTLIIPVSGYLAVHELDRQQGKIVQEELVEFMEAGDRFVASHRAYPGVTDVASLMTALEREALIREAQHEQQHAALPPTDYRNEVERQFSEVNKKLDLLIARR